MSARPWRKRRNMTPRRVRKWHRLVIRRFTDATGMTAPGWRVTDSPSPGVVVALDFNGKAE